MDAAALSLKGALLDAERMQQVEERVAGLLLESNTHPAQAPAALSKRRRGQRR